MKPRTRAKKLMDAAYTDLMKCRQGKLLKKNSLVEFVYRDGAFSISRESLVRFMTSWPVCTENDV